MIVIMIDDEVWSVAMCSLHEPRVISNITSYAIKIEHRSKQSIMQLVEHLGLASHCGHALLVGLSPSYYHSIILPQPAEVSATELMLYSRIKIAKCLNLAVDECAMDYYPLNEDSVYVVGCRRSLIELIQKVARQARLRLCRIDLNEYGFLAAQEVPWSLPEGIAMEDSVSAMTAHGLVRRHYLSAGGVHG